MSSIETSECEEIHFNMLTLWAQKKLIHQIFA